MQTTGAMHSLPPISFAQIAVLAAAALVSCASAGSWTTERGDAQRSGRGSDNPLRNAPNGSIAWARPLNVACSGGAPIVLSADAATAFLPCGPVMLAASLASGATLWRQALGDVVRTPTVTLDGAHVLCSTRNGTVVALAAADGAIRWSYAAPGVNATTRATVHIAAASAAAYTIVAAGDTLDARSTSTGALMWRTFLTANASVGGAGAAVVSLALDGDFALVLTSTMLHVVNASTGSVVWRADTRYGGTPLVGVAVDVRQRSVVTSSNMLADVWRRADGVPVRNTSLCGYCTSSNTVLPPTLIIQDYDVPFGSYDALIYARPIKGIAGFVQVLNTELMTPSSEGAVVATPHLSWERGLQFGYHMQCSPVMSADGLYLFLISRHTADSGKVVHYAYGLMDSQPPRGVIKWFVDLPAVVGGDVSGDDRAEHFLAVAPDGSLLARLTMASGPDVLVMFPAVPRTQ